MTMPNTTDVAGKYLTFRLAEEEYGLQILKVQEILGIMPVTKVPRTPTFIRGVVNLRGKVIPVVDLRSKFDIEAMEDTATTCIIVVQVQTVDDQVIMGIIVDSVSEVLDIKADQVEPAPAFGTAVDTTFILGMGKVADKVVMLLDIDRVLSNQDIQAVSHATA